MSLDYQNRVMALAGIVQAVHLVPSAARSGLISHDSLETSLKSIFIQNPDSISDVYGGTGDIRLGLSLLSDMLKRFDANSHGELLKYSLAAMALERGLARRPDVSRDLGARIAEIGEKRMLSDTSVDDTVASLANLYETTLSRLDPRINIAGNQNHLQNIANVQRIRALLLSAIRSAVLWNQVGGRRWQLLLCRNQLKMALDNII